MKAQRTTSYSTDIRGDNAMAKQAEGVLRMRLHAQGLPHVNASINWNPGGFYHVVVTASVEEEIV